MVRWAKCWEPVLGHTTFRVLPKQQIECQKLYVLLAAVWETCTSAGSQVTPPSEDEFMKTRVPMRRCAQACAHPNQRSSTTATPSSWLLAVTSAATARA